MQTTTRIGLLLLLAWGSYGCAAGTAGVRDQGPSTGDSTGTGDNNGTGIGPGGTITTPPGGSGGDGTDQPGTCAEAAAAKSYVGCEFWPTVTFNPVYPVFDFAAVVANASSEPAEVKVDRNGTMVASATVAPGSLEKLYLPWVPELKGQNFDAATNGGRPTASVRVDHGAYHLTSSVPVTAWQFNPLEYKAGSGGAPGKNWTCTFPPSIANGNGVDCLSVSNDASLLIPTTALTGHYRLFGKSGVKTGASTPDMDKDSPGAFAITGTQDGTSVTIALPASASVEGSSGNGVAPMAAGSKVTFPLGAGDVVELLGTRGKFWGDPNADLSGSVVVADKPIQIIATTPITNIPTPEVPNNGFADHLEETVLPAEVLGDHYVVAPPTTPQGKTVGHYVRFYGNFDGTMLTYVSGTAPAGAPASLKAGDVIEIGPVLDAFEVQGTSSFAVSSMMMGGQIQDPPMGTRGDPSLSFMVAIAQFRSSYTFLAPSDYEVSYADILIPQGANVKLDDAPLKGMPTAIGTSSWSIVREPLSGGMNGAHKLTADREVGLQVMGFGHATSYYYPGGLNLKLIAPPPDIAK
jgi:hypothetical protein